MTAVIIINWNGADDTIECLKSLEKAGGSFRVTVADNGSTDDSVSRIRAFAAGLSYETDVLELGENWGFAVGNNKAIAFARSYSPDSYLLLNNDTVVTPGFLERIRNYRREHPETAVLGPLVNYYSDRERIWSCGGRLVFGSRKAYYRDMKVADIPHGGVIPVSFISGCALFASSSLLDSEGRLLSERFFFGEEDYEFALRMRRRGEKMAILTDSVIYHKVGVSAGKASGQKAIGRHYIYYLGRLIVVREHYSSLEAAIIRLISRPKCIRWFMNDGLERKAAKILTDRLMYESRTRYGISREDFMSIVTDGTYFEN